MYLRALLDRDSCTDRRMDLSHSGGGLWLDRLVMVFRQRLRVDAVMVLSLVRERVIVVLGLNRAGVLKSFRTGLVLCLKNTFPKCKGSPTDVLKFVY